MDMKKLLLAFATIISIGVSAQTGGVNSFAFTEFTYNAKDAGLGGDFITGYNDDVNMGVLNPAHLNPKMQKSISVNQSLLAGGVNFGMFNYGFNVKDWATMSAYIQYVAFGKFKRTNEVGIQEGTFSPFEMVAGVGVGKQLNKRLSVGINGRFLYSQLESYNALGMSFDFGATYRIEEKGFLVTMLAKNIGVEFMSHVRDRKNTPTRVDVQLGLAYKIPKAPFRLTIMAHNLNRWDLTYNDPNLKPTKDPLTGEVVPVKRPGFGEKLMRHFKYQLEVIVTKNIDLRLAFDLQQRKEIALAQRPGLGGFSFGLGLNFKKFGLDYGINLYSRAGVSNVLTLRSNIGEWRKRK